MDAINERFKQLRKALGMSQTAFGELLGIGKSGVSEIENGRNRVMERHITYLKNYNKKNINEDWLRYGEGEMFKPIDAALSEISFGDDEFIKDFLEVYLNLDQDCKNALKEIMYRMADKYTKNDRGT